MPAGQADLTPIWFPAVPFFPPFKSSPLCWRMKKPCLSWCNKTNGQWVTNDHWLQMGQPKCKRCSAASRTLWASRWGTQNLVRAEPRHSKENLLCRLARGLKWMSMIWIGRQVQNKAASRKDLEIVTYTMPCVSLGCHRQSTSWLHYITCTLPGNVTISMWKLDVRV